MKKVCIISFPWAANPPYVFLSDFIKILSNFPVKMILIDGNINRIKVDTDIVETIDIGTSSRYVNDIKPRFLSIILWILNDINIQLRISREIIKRSRDIDVIFFYIAYPHFLLPLITAIVLNKKTVEFATRSKNKQSAIEKILSLQDLLYNNLLDYISPESYSLSKQFSPKIQNKILPSSARFIDDRLYKKTKKIKDRNNVVGYVGRLTLEKGVIKFIDSKKFISDQTTEFVVVGRGKLYEDIKNRTNSNIKLIDWVPHDELPTCLNEIKILILPSDSEGLPTIILEAMACGTIVLVTPVGGIPDIIIDNANGFIINDNTPEGIATCIDRILKNPNLEEISENAVQIIQDNYTYTESVNRYNGIMKKLKIY